ncbi:hypothetical protein TSOC_012289 [Tetrabaena socialis]|uniref:Uncharacterized protein n=1 Tax=Tetrabaena socialis TaxID=47790 RepID=A0A2J7ZNF4_9CHLO|nr:hypothetical protein TSOC_012289 [Tetrabaena socialis]|eukprot:PNH01804.1 hypothetical protein TSOC_012289 [Tetrabaena socialis]
MQTRRDLPALEQQAKQLLRAAGLDPRMLVVQWGREESIIEDTPMYEEDEEYAGSDGGFDSEDDEEGAYEWREMERRHERREMMRLLSPGLLAGSSWGLAAGATGTLRCTSCSSGARECSGD